jgi:hypothetical protein
VQCPPMNGSADKYMYDRRYESKEITEWRDFQKRGKGVNGARQTRSVRMWNRQKGNFLGGGFPQPMPHQMIT